MRGLDREQAQPGADPALGRQRRPSWTPYIETSRSWCAFPAKRLRERAEAIARQDGETRVRRRTSTPRAGPAGAAA